MSESGTAPESPVAEAVERLTAWATDSYRDERAKFPFGVYANPRALKADILTALSLSPAPEQEKPQ